MLNPQGPPPQGFPPPPFGFPGMPFLHSFFSFPILPHSPIPKKKKPTSLTLPQAAFPHPPSISPPAVNSPLPLTLAALLAQAVAACLPFLSLHQMDFHLSHRIRTQALQPLPFRQMGCRRFHRRVGFLRQGGFLGFRHLEGDRDRDIHSR